MAKQQIKHPFIPGVKIEKHHLIPKVRGGTFNDGFLKLWCFKHRHWHLLFFLKTLDEIIFEIDKYYMTRSNNIHWRILFKDKKLWEVKQLLLRVKYIKKRKVREIY